MLAIPKQTMEGTFPSHGLLAPPSLHRSNTGRRPQRSSPLAGPAVSVSDSEDAPNLLRASSSPNLNRNSLSPPKPRPVVLSGLTRPKSMYSTLSSHTQSFSPPDRSHEPGNKPMRPMSAVLSMSTTRVHLSEQYSGRPHTAADFRSLDEQTCSRYSQIPPLTDKHPFPSTTHLRPPTIMLNEKSIEAPQIPIPPRARSTSRITETTIPRDNSWYVTSVYEETPRFSRLGMAADSVVMPVSAKKYKKVHRPRQQSSGNRDSMSVNSGDKPATNAASGNRQSLLIGSLASSLKLTMSNIRTSSPTSSRASSTDSASSPASSTASTLSPDSNLSRRTSSFTDSSSTYTCFTPDIVTSSSRTSINEDEEAIHKSFPTLPLNKETSVVSPAVNKDEKPRRGGPFKRFIRLFH